MDELFHVSERKSTIGTELRAGLTTFLAMAYIIAVNPAVLSGAGIDAGALACATCLGAGIMTICMGIFANRPLACASGLGINAMIAGIATTMCGGDWHVAMSVIFLEGIVILLLVLCGLREAIMDAIPVVLRHAISVGLGLFIAMIGLCDAGIITAGAGTLVGLGDIASPTFIVGIISIIVTVALASRNVPGSLLIGIIVAVIAGIPLGVTHAPEGLIAPLDFSTFGAPFASTADGNMAIVKVLTDPMLLVVAFSLLMSDFFDTMGTAMAVAKQGEFLTEDGNVEDIRPILVVDSVVRLEKPNKPNAALLSKRVNANSLVLQPRLTRMRSARAPLEVISATSAEASPAPHWPPGLTECVPASARTSCSTFRSIRLADVMSRNIKCACNPTANKSARPNSKRALGSPLTIPMSCVPFACVIRSRSPLAAKLFQAC